MRYGVVVEELAVEVMARLPNDRARQEGMALVEVARMDPRAWPDVRDPGSVEEIREAFGRRCWIQFMPHAGAVEVRGIGWAGWSQGSRRRRSSDQSRSRSSRTRLSPRLTVCRSRAHTVASAARPSGLPRTGKTARTRAAMFGWSSV